MDSARCLRDRDIPSGNPRQKRGAQGLSRLRVAFSLGTFFWPRKRKYLALGGETPIQHGHRAAIPYSLETQQVMPEPVIRIIDLNKTYEAGLAQPVPVLKQVNFQVEEGEFVTIMGPSGSGKSTLMNIIGCLDIPSNGHYFLSGRDTARLSVDELAGLRNRLLGFVFQGFNLLPRMDILDNVALPLLYSGVDKAERRRRALKILSRVGLERHTRHWPNQLSGGQQQRAAIARALVTGPRLILADEPTGNLDTHTSEEIMTIFSRLNIEQGITLVLVTHELDIARHARRLIRIVDGQIAFDGEVATYLAEVAT